jgi:hypothetical protein
MAKCAASTAESSTMRSFVFFSLACFASLNLIACGGSTDTPADGGDEASTDDGGADVVVEAAPDVDNGAVSTTYPAFKVDAPQVVTGGGAVLATPKVVPVYFSNDSSTFTDSVTTFLGKMAASTYWGPSITEYGVGALSIATPVQLAEAAPTTIDDSAIQTWLASKLTDATLPAPDANTVYVLFYPSATTSITLQGETSCQQFGGYHSDIAYKTTDVAYAVIPRCAKFGGLTGLDAVSATTSHEVIEASTDPYPSTQGTAAYGQVDDNHIIWMFVLGGGETGDMCAQNQDSFYAPTDIGNYVQRTWSNASAKAGHNPCLPSSGQAYFNSMPVLTDKLSLGGGQLVTKGVTIPVGQEKTIEVDLFSDAATGGPWQVSATDTATLQNQAPELQFTWDRTSGQNGEKLHLTIKVLKASQYNAEGFIITSRLGARENLWIGTVGN